MLREMRPEELTGWRAFSILKAEEADERAGGAKNPQVRRPARARTGEPHSAPTQARGEDWAETGPNELPPDVGIGGVPLPPAALWEQ